VIPDFWPSVRLPLGFAFGLVMTWLPLELIHIWVLAGATALVICCFQLTRCSHFPALLGRGGWGATTPSTTHIHSP